MQYLPFTELKNRKAIIVDSLHPNGEMLSHWRGAPTKPEYKDDTSAGIVLNAIKRNPDLLNFEFVTANHFDIDAFVGVWSMLNPELALQHDQLLRQMAKIGDFRELDLSQPEAGNALKLVCWLNALEKELFYPPFGTDELEENEVEASPPKFRYFLANFERVLLDPEAEKSVWEPEYKEVLKACEKISSEETQIRRYPEIGLIVLNLPEPVHYYALFGVTEGFDIVLSIYNHNRYELEYKYTTWVDYYSRPTLPRLPLKPLAAELQQLETSEFKWFADQVTDTGPLLRLNKNSLPKSQRYANPTERPIYSSSISPENLEQLVVNYFKEGYTEIKPKQNWSWAEIKAFTKNMAQPDVKPNLTP